LGDASATLNRQVRDRSRTCLLSATSYFDLPAQSRSAAASQLVIHLKKDFHETFFLVSGYVVEGTQHERARRRARLTTGIPRLFY
jgi:hypothetical protein